MEIDFADERPKPKIPLELQAILPILIVSLLGLSVMLLVQNYHLIPKPKALQPDPPAELVFPTYPPDTPAQTILGAKVSNRIPDDPTKWATYTNKTIGYSFQYPLDWTGGIQPNSSGQKYPDFAIKSPDYILSDTSSGFTYLKEGAVLRVLVENASASSAAQLVDQSSLIRGIARNKVVTTVANREALRYEYTYEGISATDTVIIYNGRSYTLRLQYADFPTRSKWMIVYTKALESFAFN